MLGPCDSILLVGRGASAYSFDWACSSCPTMAISSGIFAMQRSVRADHFVSLDEPKNYMAQLMAHAPHAWQHDAQCQYWPFWADPGIVKHVIARRIRTVVNLPLPVGECIAAIVEHCTLPHVREWMKRKRITTNKIKDAFYRELGNQYTQFGLQPGWGDYQNVQGWNVKARRFPQWSGEGALSLWHAQGRSEVLYNSLLMAVQIAVRLGYTTLKFIGVDLTDPMYAGLLKVMQQWHGHAVRHGLTWINLAPDSALAQFIPTEQVALAA